MDTPKLKFTFGALKAIKSELGIDFLSGSEGEKEKDIKPSNFEDMARLAIRWSQPGITDEEAKEQAQYITIAEVTKALNESIGSLKNE